MATNEDVPGPYAQARDDEAASWVVRRDRGPLKPDEEAAFRHWLSSDSRNQGAYVRADAAWAQLRTVGRVPEHGLARRRLLAAGVTAAIAVPLGGVGWYAARRPPALTIETRAGDVRRLAVAQGAKVTVDALTRLAVVPRRAQTVLSLQEGRLWLEIQPGSRPLLVEAAEVTLAAHAAEFVVSRHATQLKLLVVAGAIEARDAEGARTIGRETEASFDRGALLATRGVQGAALYRERAWAEGRLVFEGETVAQAAATFNRYNATQIEVEGDALRSRPIVGYFRIDDPSAFCAAVVQSFGARLSRRGAVLVIEATDAV